MRLYVRVQVHFIFEDLRLRFYVHISQKAVKEPFERKYS